jgi:hypothetical protein
VKTGKNGEYVIGCGEGLFFIQYSDLRFDLLDEKIFFGKYVT